jgi:hypothetical protein
VFSWLIPPNDKLMTCRPVQRRLAKCIADFAASIMQMIIIALQYKVLGKTRQQLKKTTDL